jgi:hypothetical protein
MKVEILRRQNRCDKVNKRSVRVLLVLIAIVLATTLIWLERPASANQERDLGGETAMTFTVTSTAASGIGSLQQAILDANGNAGMDTIDFAIPSSDPNCNATTHVCTITPTVDASLPSMTDPVLIDGYSQPGASVNTLANGDNAVLLIEIDGSTPNIGPGIRFRAGASGSVIKGLVVDNGWSRAILVETDTVSVEGCFIGIDPSGFVARPNTEGVFADFNQPTSGLRVGGTTPAARNVISGNSHGIFFQSGSNHVVQGNYIGTDRNGTAAVANGIGIIVQGSDDALIGGTTIQQRNIIAANTNAQGIRLSSAARSRIQGNFIGTDVTGTTALGFIGNAAVDVDFATSATEIGGVTATPGTPPGNVISGGSATGIQIGVGINNVHDTAVMGNLIGTDASGTKGLGNLRGVVFGDPSNTVGGTGPMARNVISANGIGIVLQSQNDQVQGNFIGTDISGTQLLGNGGDGVFALANNSTVSGNIIAGNGGSGVNVLFGSTTGIAVLGNSIYSNAGLGIDLSGDGVTPNDNCDGDTGANNLQNFPVITSATFAGGMATITGTLDSEANTTYRLEFFASTQGDPSGSGEGQTFIGAVNRTTDASCTAAFGPLSFPVPAGQSVVTATATRLNASLDPVETSEFSAFLTSRPTLYDFDGDGRADVSVFRPSERVWYMNQSLQGFTAREWGLAIDPLVPADYDGDGKTDIASWREDSGDPGRSYFDIINSLDNSLRKEQFGSPGDKPIVAGDWDGDGDADLAVYRDGGAGGQSFFFYRPSAQPGVDFITIPWGTGGDVPMRGDFDGDGKQDAAVFRPSDNLWYILYSSDGSVHYESWGLACDTFVPADYDGDHKTDLAVFRIDTWYIRRSSDGQPVIQNFGLPSDILVPADFDGDQRTDLAVFRNGDWYILQSQTGSVAYVNFGLAGDTPVESAYTFSPHCASRVPAKSP